MRCAGPLFSAAVFGGIPSAIFRSFTFLMERESRLIELQLAVELPRQIFLSRSLRQFNRLLGAPHGVTESPVGPVPPLCYRFAATLVEKSPTPRPDCFGLPNSPV